MSESKFIAHLLFKRLNGVLTPQEKQRLERWKNASVDNQRFMDEFDKESMIKRSSESEHLVSHQRLEKIIYDKISARIPELQKPAVKMKTSWASYAAAAAILLLLIGGAWKFLSPAPHKYFAAVKKRVAHDIAAPAGNFASITLANGQKVDLNSSANGMLASQGKVQVIKLADGSIAYKTDKGAIEGEMQFNTLSNPQGSAVINMALEDGTIVWLNAGSSLTYPVAFAGTERRVSITGEAYFEVAKNKEMPFVLSKGNMEIKVLGTHFNVNAYQDEPDIKVTLLEGSVKISSATASEMLKPGEQAKVVKEGNINIAPDIDIDNVMAWKNGFFSFDKAGVETIMRQISRWYNVQVKYEGSIPDEIFGGELRRNSTLSSVLKVLEKSGVKFRIGDGQVTVFK